MSVSNESTAAVSHDDEVSRQVSDSYVYGVGRPGESPYAGTSQDIATFFIGPKATEFSIHRAVIRQSVPLSSKCGSWTIFKDEPILPELDEETAHTLFHYLYTGRYETLLPSVNPPASYRHATRVYCAGARYELPALATLAQTQLAALEYRMSLNTILAVARDDGFPLLPADDTWYAAYVARLIERAMDADPEPCRRPEFVALVEGNRALLEVAWTTVVRYGTGTARTSGVVTPEPCRDDEMGAEKDFDAGEHTDEALRESGQKAVHARSDSAIEVDDMVTGSGALSVDGADMEKTGEAEVGVVEVQAEPEPELKSMTKKARKKGKRKMELLPMGV